MAKTKKLLEKSGITDEMLRKLYRYDLLDVLEQIDGIGCKRVDEIKGELVASNNDLKRLPNTWVYRLGLDVLRLPSEVELLCQPHAGQPPLLDELAEMDGKRMNEFSDWLSGALSNRDQTVITGFYRQQQNVHQLASKFGVSYQQIVRMKQRALNILSMPKHSSALASIIFSKSNSDKAAT